MRQGRQVIPETAEQFETTRLIERPNGFYWQTRDGAREYGPFDTLLAAAQDMARIDDEEDPPEPGETLEEAESEIGIADWIDPDTGEPAEGDLVRLEEH